MYRPERRDRRAWKIVRAGTRRHHQVRVARAGRGSHASPAVCTWLELRPVSSSRFCGCGSSRKPCAGCRLGHARSAPGVPERTVSACQPIEVKPGTMAAATVRSGSRADGSGDKIASGVRSFELDAAAQARPSVDHRLRSLERHGAGGNTIIRARGTGRYIRFDPPVVPLTGAHVARREELPSVSGLRVLMAGLTCPSTPSRMKPAKLPQPTCGIISA